MIVKDRGQLTRYIKTVAAWHGVSLAELGRKMGMCQPSISRTVNRSDIPFSELVRMAAALGCDLDITFKAQGTGEQPPTD